MMTILDALYLLVGIMFAATAIINLRDSSNAKRWKSAGFWGINAIIFIFGSYLPALANGILVIVMVLLAGLGGLGRSGKAETSLEQREVRASRFGNRLFIPALLIPLVTLLGTFAFKSLTWNGALLIPAGSSTLAALGLGIIVAFFAALVMLHETPASAMHEGRRLLDAIGWASVLPQMLAALGGNFRPGRRGQAGGWADYRCHPAGPARRRGGHLLHRHGAVYHYHGQRLCGLSHHDRGHRFAYHRRPYGRQSGHYVRYRHVGRLLRHIDYSHGGQF